MIEDINAEVYYDQSSAIIQISRDEHQPIKMLN